MSYVPRLSSILGQIEFSAIVCSLSLHGSVVKLKELTGSIAAYKGEPCCLTHPAASKLPCAPLRAYIMQLKTMKQQYTKQANARKQTQMA